LPSKSAILSAPETNQAGWLSVIPVRLKKRMIARLNIDR